MELQRRKRNRGRGVRGEEEELRDLVSSGQEDGVGIAFESSEDVGTEILLHVSMADATL